MTEQLASEVPAPGSPLDQLVWVLGSPTTPGPDGAPVGWLVVGIGLSLTLLTVALHAGACIGIGRLFQGRLQRPPATRVSAVVTLFGVTLLLLVSHLVQVLIWALAFWNLGLLPGIESAFYFAFTSYSTVGYGDLVLESPWRSLGSILGANGYMMFGLSTALLFTVLVRLTEIPPASD
jgi:hypothetical protein